MPDSGTAYADLGDTILYVNGIYDDENDASAEVCFRALGHWLARHRSEGQALEVDTCQKFKPTWSPAKKTAPAIASPSCSPAGVVCIHTSTVEHLVAKNQSDIKRQFF